MNRNHNNILKMIRLLLPHYKLIIGRLHNSRLQILCKIEQTRIGGHIYKIKQTGDGENE